MLLADLRASLDSQGQVLQPSLPAPVQTPLWGCSWAPPCASSLPGWAWVHVQQHVELQRSIGRSAAGD